MSISAATVVFSLAVASVMWGLGLSLVRADFEVLLRRPAAVGIALVAQTLAPPLCAALLARVFSLDPGPTLGLVLLAACPAGPLSNVYTALAGGNLALSVSVTALNSLSSAVTLPVTLWAARTSLTGANTGLPVSGQAAWLAVTLLVGPVLLGMWQRAAKPALAARLLKGVRAGAAGLLVLVVVVVLSKEGARSLDGMPRLLEAVVAFNLVCLALGALVGRSTGDRRDATATAFVFSVRNGSIAISAASSAALLDDPHVALPAIVYSVVQSVSSIGLTALLRRSRN